MSSHSTLTRALKSLRNKDGTRNLLERRSALSHLVDHGLSSQEVRDLRAKLDAIALHKDIFMSLPLELLFRVIEYLDLEEVMRARGVSRAWNARLSSSDLCLEISRLHFRAEWELSYKSLDAEGQNMARETFTQWLPAASRTRVRRERGRYRSLHFYVYEDLGPRRLSVSANEQQYSNGRIAVRQDGRMIIVNSLRIDGNPRFLMFEDRQPIQEWLLSDQFLIAQKAHPKLALYAWELEGDLEDQVRLPSSVGRMSAYRDQIGLITKSKEVLVWHIGVSLNLLDISGTYEHIVGFTNWEVSSILFHPTKKSTSFVFCQAWPDRGVVDSSSHKGRIIVQQFVKEKPTALYITEFSPSHVIQNLPHEPGKIGLASADGLVSIGWTSKPLEGAERAIMLVTFDMYEMKFHHSSRYFPIFSAENMSGAGMDQILIWRNHALIPASSSDLNRGFPTRTETLLGPSLTNLSLNSRKQQLSETVTKSKVKSDLLGVKDKLLVAIREGGGNNERLGPILCCGTDDFEDNSNVSCSIDEGYGLGISYLWVLWNQRAERCGFDTSSMLRGDEDFVVFLGEAGYAVWRFDKHATLPRGGQKGQ